MFTKIITFLFGAKVAKEEWVKWLKWGIILIILLKLRTILNWLKLQFDKVTLTKIDNPYMNGGFLTTAYIENLAKRLLNAMSGLGTNEDELNAVYNILLQYPQNVINVYSTFGTPKYFAYGLSDWFGTPSDLKAWLKSELSAYEFKKWADLFKLSGL